MMFGTSNATTTIAMPLFKVASKGKGLITEASEKRYRTERKRKGHVEYKSSQRQIRGMYHSIDWTKLMVSASSAQ